MTSRSSDDFRSSPAAARAPFNSALPGALLAGTGTALGAFGAHALKSTLSADMLGVFETGVRYQMYGGLGLLALGALPTYQGLRARVSRRAPALLLAGTVVFSGSLYLLSLSGVKWLGAVTPIGGVLLLLGWGQVALDVKNSAGPRSES
jgi:uncharacterized membrane protein YgdD (TMEM256/DUF423 family)